MESSRYLQTLSDLFIAELEEKVSSSGERVDSSGDITGGLEAVPTTQFQIADRLGEALVREGLLTSEQLSNALAHQLLQGGRLGKTLITLGMLSEADLARVQARILQIDFHPPESLNTSPDVVSLLPESLVRKYELIPISRQGSTIIIGMVDPTNVFAIDDVRFASRCPVVKTRLITPSMLQRFTQIVYGRAAVEEEVLQEAPSTESEEPFNLDGVPLEDLEEIKEDILPANVVQIQNEASLPPVVKLGNYVLSEALKRRASDIHIEPYESSFRIRFRIDGMLHTMMTPPRALHTPFIGRMKILSGMDISIHRLPQDGHLAVRQRREVSHFRVSILPTSYGEKCVIRLLKKEAHLADIEKLGFHEDLLKQVKRVARMSQGMVLVTGPTGSGKTTTLHAMINHINDPGINIVTLEDPVEMTLPGVNHVQVEPKGGVSFASGLRSILRQDPDVVFVGEMRDEEVSRIAVKAALTGHLVLSTLHTNGVVETFSRLIDMHIEPYLLASSVRLVIAQRLIRKLCVECTREEPLPAEIIEEFHLDTLGREFPFTHKVPVGCPNCMDSGYRGRLAVYEAIIPDDDFKRLLRQGAKEDDLVAYTRERNLRTMYDEGLDKAFQGVSTYNEVRRILAG